MWRDLRTRILTAIILIPLALYAVYAGSWPFQVFLIVVGAGLLMECSRLIHPDIKPVWWGSASLYLALLVILDLSLSALFGAWAAGVIMLMLLHMSGRESARAVMIAFVYCGGFIIAFKWLRGDSPAGFLICLFIFAIVWSTDIFAYFVGRLIGGPKLWPAVSPSKTWAGAIGGASAAMLISLAFINLFQGVGSILFVLMALMTSVASQAGDLWESALKRRAGVKDSGNLLPGHGGIFDRVDGLIAAVWVVMLILLFINLLGAGANLNILPQLQ